MADRAGEGQPLALVEQRLDHEDVGQVHAAVERVVHDEDVALGHVVTEVTHDGFHGGRHRAEMPGQGQALGRELAVGIGEARRIIHVVLEHAGIGRPEDRERHLVGDRENGVLEELQRDRIGHRHFCIPPGICSRHLAGLAMQFASRSGRRFLRSTRAREAEPTG